MENIKRGAFVTFTIEDKQGQGIVTEVREDLAVVANAEYDAELKAYVEAKPQIVRELPLADLNEIKTEVRNTEDIHETRAYESNMEIKEGRVVRGYASVFNSMSEDLGGFREIIEPGAFSDVLTDDVRALYNHDSNYLLARTTSGTLSLWQDERGLGYEFEMPNTTYGNDMLELFKRGDLTQSSFGFTIASDRWEQKDGEYIRYIEKVGSLFDVSPVVYPAYTAATSGTRSAEPDNEPEEVNLNYYLATIKLKEHEC